MGDTAGVVNHASYDAITTTAAATTSRSPFRFGGFNGNGCNNNNNNCDDDNNNNNNTLYSMDTRDYPWNTSRGDPRDDYYQQQYELYGFAGGTGPRFDSSTLSVPDDDVGRLLDDFMVEL